MEYALLAICALTLLASLATLLRVRSNEKGEEARDEALRRTETELAGLRAQTESNARAFADQTEALRQRVDAMSRDAGEERHRLIGEIREQLDAMSAKTSVQTEKLTGAVSDAPTRLTETNDRKLEQMRQTVDEKLNETLTKRLDDSFRSVSEQLEKLYVSLGEMRELSGSVSGSITDLSRILTNVKARGTWAEYQLEAILDQTVPGMYEKDFHPDGGRDMVEFAVRLPGEAGAVTYLPVDSKFPMEDYARLCAAREAGDAGGAEAASKALERRVTDEARNVNKYIHVPQTTPFAILYLATEGLYAEIAASKNGLPENLQNEYSVLVAGPTTITALLSSVAMGMKTMTVNEKANEIRLLLIAVRKQYDLFAESLAKIRRKLGEAESSVDDAAKRGEIIRKKLRAVDAGETPALPPETEETDG